jgi:hypothetical protein
MKRLFSAIVPAEEAALQLLRSTLEGEGIACVVRNELLSVAKGDAPPTECFPELWIVEDADYSKAKEIVDDWRVSTTEPHAPWVCAHCRETSEGQFTSCWKCGKDREEAWPSHRTLRREVR